MKIGLILSDGATKARPSPTVLAGDPQDGFTCAELSVSPHVFCEETWPWGEGVGFPLSDFMELTSVGFLTPRRDVGEGERVLHRTTWSILHAPAWSWALQEIPSHRYCSEVLGVFSEVRKVVSASCVLGKHAHSASKGRLLERCCYREQYGPAVSLSVLSLQSSSKRTRCCEFHT